VKALRIVVKLLVSVVFFGVLLSFVKTNELMAVFARVNWLYLSVAILLSPCMVLASCAKWKLILDLKGEKVSFWQLLKIYLIGYFFSNILPSTVGGDVVRFYYAGRLIGNQPFAAVSVFFERFSGIVLLFFLVAVAPLFYPSLYRNPQIWLPASAGLIFGLVTIWIWLAKNPFSLPNRLSGWLFGAIKQAGQGRGRGIIVRSAALFEKFYEKVIARLKKLHEELQVAVAAVRHDSAFLRRLIGLTVLFYLLTWANVYFSFKAFNVEVSFLAVCAIVPAVMLVAHIPVTLLGNLGYFESVFVFYFLLVGVGGAESLAMGLLLRAKMLAMGALGFISYLAYRQEHRLDLPPVSADRKNF
jgi:glycosyltransferase 2 family protein